jgi:hypothetical protein
MNLTRILHQFPALLVSAFLLAASGCATKSTGNTAPRPGSGLAEYRELVQRSQLAIESALRSLQTLSNPTPANPNRVVSAFSEEVDRLGAASVQVRARAQAMQARGDAYFENWHENMASIEDPRVRALAEQHRADLQRSFANIKLTLQQTRESFQSFLGSLRKLRTTLETDAARLSSNSTRDQVQETERVGHNVQAGLSAVALELRHMSEMLIPPGSTAEK